MKLKLNPRKHIEKDIGDGESVIIKYYDKSGKQIKAQRKLIESKDKTMLEFQELMEKQFWENIEAPKEVIDTLKQHFDENGGFDDFMSELDTELGKLKKRD